MVTHEKGAKTTIIHYSEELDQYFKTAQNLQIANLLLDRLEGVKERLLGLFEKSAEPMSLRDIETFMDSNEEKWTAHIATVMLLQEGLVTPCDDYEVLTRDSGLILEWNMPCLKRDTRA